MMKLLVLCGGLGTRLQAVLNDVPKALAPVGSVPFLHLQIENWKNQGIRSFVFLLHHQADLIIKFLQSEQQIGVLFDCEVRWLVESRPLDTGGAVANAVEQLRLTDNFLVTNADTWLGTGIANVSQDKSPAMAVVELSDSSRYGSVQFDKQFRVSIFQEKSSGSQKAGWINAGLFQMNVETFKDWDRLPFSLERAIFPAMVSRGELKAVTLKTEFIDIGIPEDYYRLCKWMATDRKGPL
jgi:D-glycero-alpha-D-manno-heptose 1-phosphate guanylyltransferase